MSSLKKTFSIVLMWLTFCVTTMADYPIASQHYAADPTGLEFNGRIYLYCSNDEENGTNGYDMASIACFSTDDLKNWTDHGSVFKASQTAWANLTWAPSAVSNNNQVYLYFANGAGSIGVATSSVPTGPFTDARGSALITGSTPGAATSTQWLFDPCAFIDDDGQAYLYFGGQYPTNARVIRLNSNLSTVGGAASPMFATNLFEASYMHKRDGIYYYTYCNRFEYGAAIYCETNSNPTNGFSPAGTVLANPPQNVHNNNHHSIFSFKGNWYIAYHNRAAALQNGLSNADAVYKRSLCLDRINYNPDGSIQQVVPTADGLTQLKNLDPFHRVEGETIAQQFGIKTEVCNEGGMDVTSITNGCWICVRGVDFAAGAIRFYARVASASVGGNIELHLDSPDGTLIGTCAVSSTGGWQSWTTVSCDIEGAKDVHDLYLKFAGGTGNLFNLNWWQFQAGSGAGSASPLSIEAESGALGGDWTVNNSVNPAVTNITITSNGSGNNPGSAARVATYTITFPGPGTYQLYARIRVGANGYDDDSLFYASSFGTKSPTANSDWVFVNGLAGVGFSNSGDVVTGGGTLGSGIWKWINLSQFSSQSGFTVAQNQLTQTFSIGAREDGLEIDKFAFGPAGYSFTVADLDAGGPGTAPDPNITIDAAKAYQTIEGLGGAIAFYNGWITAHPYRLEIYTNAFAGLNLSMLRLGNWFRYQGTSNFDPDAPGFVSNANRILGHPIPVYMSSWAPPAFLKSNGQVGNGGTLVMTNGGFAYADFANYWYDSLLAYESNGISPTWISIQNEPDFAASYDSCVFRPTEGVYNGTNYASYPKALDAVYQRLSSMASPPKLLAPEVVGLGYNDVQNYAATMNPNSFYGVAHHLYGGSTDGTPDGYKAAMSALTNVFPNKPRFMTEYGVTNMIEQANLIHNVLTVEQASGYNYWSLIWPGNSGGLIQIENPWTRSSWTNAPAGTSTQSHGWWLAPAYWAMKHYSYFIQPGFKCVATTSSDADVLASSYLSPDGLRLVSVIINRSTSVSSTMNFNANSFPFLNSSVYQTADTNHFQWLGPADSRFNLPPLSLTTIVLDKFVNVGQATDPLPIQNATGIGYDAVLSWSSGSNAITHLVYLGTSSNAVAQATPTSPEFKGSVATNFISAALSGGVAYYWRVDEIAGANTNTGVVWSFNTAPLPALAHRYSFDEISGTTVTDSVGGAAWNGSLPNGGTFASGQLALASGASQYVNLPPDLLSSFNNFTIETWVKLNSAASWTRIFDFGNNTTSYMFLTPQNGSTSRLRFAITTNGPGNEQQINGNSNLSAGTWYHVAVTLNGSIGVLYLNGVPVGTNNAMTLTPASFGGTVNNYIGRSQYSADAFLNAVLDDFRIYSVALSAAEIAATYALGPSEILNTGSPMVSVTRSPANLTFNWPLASAGFQLQVRTNLSEGNWVNVLSPAPQLTDDHWFVTVPIDTSKAAFYRLAK